VTVLLCNRVLQVQVYHTRADGIMQRFTRLPWPEHLMIETDAGRANAAGLILHTGLR
jgi:hypothetical protein